MSMKRDETVADFTAAARPEGAPTGRDAWRMMDERLPLFSVTSEGGPEDEPERIEYTIPAKPNAGLALEFLRVARTQGAELATSWLIEEAVGREGYQALIDELEGFGGDGAAVLRGMGEKIQRVVMGGLEGPKA